MDWRAVSFDWNQVRSFLATVEEGSLSAAARVLGLTQPTLGRQVAALEADLGVTLFERVGKALILTGAGHELLAAVRAMGQAAGQLSLAAAGQSQAVEGLVRLTVGDAVATYMLPRMLGRLAAIAPGIEVEVIVSRIVSEFIRKKSRVPWRPSRNSVISASTRAME